jgi:hypothetical protein
VPTPSTSRANLQNFSKLLQISKRLRIHDSSQPGSVPPPPTYRLQQVGQHSLRYVVSPSKLNPPDGELYRLACRNLNSTISHLIPINSSLDPPNNLSIPRFEQVTIWRFTWPLHRTRRFTHHDGIRQPDCHIFNRWSQFDQDCVSEIAVTSWHRSSPGPVRLAHRIIYRQPAPWETPSCRTNCQVHSTRCSHTTVSIALCDFLRGLGNDSRVYTQYELANRDLWQPYCRNGHLKRSRHKTNMDY